MLNIKSEYSSKLLELTSAYLAILRPDEISQEDVFIYVLGANLNDVKVCFDKITNALPDDLFTKHLVIADEEIAENIVKSFVLFMSQEDITATTFDRDFANYIYEIMNEIDMKYHLLN